MIWNLPDFPELLTAQLNLDYAENDVLGNVAGEAALPRSTDALLHRKNKRHLIIVVTSSRLPTAKVTKVYNGRAEIENRIKEGKNTLRWDKTSCQRFEANQARLQMGVLANNLLHMIRRFYVWGEEVKRSMEWMIKPLIKVGAKIFYHA